MQGLSKSKMKMEVPDPVIIDIFFKLPVKSIIRFRCLCKNFSSSLQTPHFIAKHHENNLQSNKINVLVKLYHIDAIPSETFFSALSGKNYLVAENIHIPFYRTDNFQVSGHCNGVLCLYQDVKEEVALWNPSTREVKILPKSTLERPDPRTHETNFPVFSFGFDSKNDDYKVIRFVEYISKVEFLSDGSIYQAELYSLKNDSWKELSLPQTEGIPGDSGLFNNGFCYWMIYDHSEKLRILSFDMVKEEYSILPWPATIDYFGELLDFNGSLGVCATYTLGEEGDKRIDVWVMNGSWTKQFSIERIPGVRRPLRFENTGNIFFVSLADELLLFDHVSGEFKNFGLYSCWNEMDVITYAESLVPINGKPEQEEGIVVRISAGDKQKNGEVIYKVEYDAWYREYSNQVLTG